MAGCARAAARQPFHPGKDRRGARHEALSGRAAGRVVTPRRPTAVACFAKECSLPIVLRLADVDDVPALRRLIPASARGLSVGYYTPEQIEAAIRLVFGVDSQLIADGTYFVVEDSGAIVACGGWSRRRTLYGGDQRKVAGGAGDPGAGDPSERRTGDGDALDPAVDAARIRAFFVAPSHARQGIGTRLLEACAAAARDAGFSRLELMSTRPGVPFYARLGFSAVENVADRLPDGTTLEFVRMERPIAP